MIFFDIILKTPDQMDTIENMLVTFIATGKSELHYFILNEPLLDQLLEKFPDCKFVFYGEYVLTGETFEDLFKKHTSRWGQLRSQIYAIPIRK